MRHNPAAGAVIIMLRSPQNARHGPGCRRADRTRLSGLRGRAADPVAAPEGGDGRPGGAVDRLSAQGRPLPELSRSSPASTSPAARSTRRSSASLHRCEFLEDAHNVVLVGGPGTGKTHIATAIGVQAIEHRRKRVRFFSTVELVNALEQEKLQGKSWADCRPARLFRPRHPRRAWLPAVQRLRRRACSSIC
jgi:hypothetical protein